MRRWKVKAGVISLVLVDLAISIAYRAFIVNDALAYLTYTYPSIRSEGRLSSIVSYWTMFTDRLYPMFISVLFLLIHTCRSQLLMFWILMSALSVPLRTRITPQNLKFKNAENHIINDHTSTQNACSMNSATSKTCFCCLYYVVDVLVQVID